LRHDGIEVHGRAEGVHRETVRGRDAGGSDRCLVEGARAQLTGKSLPNSHLDFRICDVAALIDDANSDTCDKFDAIRLDVHNRNDALARNANNHLSSRTGLTKARDAWIPGGILSEWSAEADPALRKRLKDSGLEVDERGIRL
jgi:hypothetical protein